MTYKNKKIIVFITIVMVGIVVLFGYKPGYKLLLMLHEHAYMYTYSKPNNLKIEDISNLPPAEAVPIIMYHGIVQDDEKDPQKIGTNAKRKDFIAQMEMLKENGYQSISISEFDKWRQGNFTLPPKPIIITFDDARVDSYYPVDEVLKKLGFKATNFVVTGRTIAQDPFFLNWGELKKMQASGRWELEAHGRNSHDKFIENSQGDMGHYLTSLEFIPGVGKESVEDYKKRVEADYVNGIEDLKKNLGIDPLYFSVPLDHYGVSNDTNYYPEAETFNKELTKKYFKMAFIEVAATDDASHVYESFYNYKDTDPMSLKRLEVKGMSAEQLKYALDHFAPKPISLTFPSTNPNYNISQNLYVPYGSITTTKNSITLSSTTTSPSSRIFFGDWGWENYSEDVDITNIKGRSMSVFIYYVDEDNYISLDLDNNSISVNEFINGKQREIGSYYPLSYNSTKKAKVMIRVFDGILDASVNGLTIVKNAPINITHGAAGFGVWDKNGAQAVINKLEITTLTEKPIPIASPSKLNNNSYTENIQVGSTPELPYTSHVFNESVWENSWANSYILKGADSWQNYYLQAKVYWAGNTDFTLISRYKNQDNYVACKFSNYGKQIDIFKVVDGDTTYLAEIPNLIVEPSSTSSWLVGMSVVNNYIGCYINNGMFLGVSDNTIPNIGRVGTNFENPNNQPSENVFKVQEINVYSIQ